ncbi:MAG: NAD-glutamate dehydrogenase domain-containing protein, partial [Candidatus Binataceae bacterium]
MNENRSGKGDGQQSTRVKIFADRMFARLPADLSDRFAPERRLALARSVFEFFAVRTETIKVRASAVGEGVIASDTAMPDCPFIVDSMMEYFRKLGMPVRMLLHPVYNVARDATGALTSFERAIASERAESFTHAEVEVVPDAPEPPALADGLHQVLAEVHQAASDFNDMTARALEICEETAAVRELIEIRDFLRWLVQGGFVFLGYRRYRVVKLDGAPALTVEPGRGRGILRDDRRSRYAAPAGFDSIDAPHRKLLFDGPPLIIGKTHAESRVHRRVPMDDFTIRRANDSGEIVAFDRFIGLLTSKAYAEEAQHIPVLRAKLAEVLEVESAQPGSHDYKELVAIFNSFPKEELFRARVPELRAQLRLILDVKNESDVRLNIQPDAVRENVIALVIMPREHFSAAVRLKIQELLATRLGGRLVYYYLAMGESYTARLHFCFAAPVPNPAAVPAIEAEVARLARTWDDLLREQLYKRHGQLRGHELAARWIGALSANYKAVTPIEVALNDLDRVEALLTGGSFSVHVGADGDNRAASNSELRMYELGEAPILSELIPVLQNFGISVVSEDAHELRPVINGQAKSAHVQAFRVRALSGGALGQKPGAALVAEALVAVRTDKAEDDPLNVLTLEAGLSWREVALVRSYLAAAFQMRLAPARPAVRRPLLLYPKLARTLVDLFQARFDPSRETAAARLDELHTAYREQLTAVDNIADDRIARLLLAIVEATVRTNYFCEVPAPDSYIALKFDSAKIPHLPDTAPLYEIHVSSPRMEGCHLRAGRIARGGIRYSDRPDDYRTEILDLMKTQTVKNAIIVPMGSKGGFILKSRAGRSPGHDAVVSAYKTLINAMLDLTDNIVDGHIIHPPAVRVLDNDGAYLVVAADKGTAAFSDIANEIAESRGFWLGDAFASGGKHGYDHKKLGITARGAWESAKRHLREMGRDLNRGAPVTMVGIG